MTLRLVVAGAAGFILAMGTAASAQDAGLIAKGKKVYDAAMPKCKMCHAIGGEGNAKGPLDGIGGKLKADEFKAWLRTPKEMATKAKAERKPPMPVYAKEKLSDEDLESLTAYLLSLKK